MEQPGAEQDSDRGHGMKKLLFLMVVGFGGTMLLKGNYVTITPDQVRVAGLALPIPASIQASPIMGMVTTLFQGNLGPTTTSARPRPGMSALPNVTSAVGTYNANAPNTGQTQGGDQFNSVARALH
jgi:hypothetical protein